MNARDSILIRRDVEEVFSIVKDVENYGKFSPSYEGAQVLVREGNNLTVERTAKILGKRMRWTSEAEIGERTVTFKQSRGPLKGMVTQWNVEREDSATRVTILHDHRFPIPLVGGFLSAKIVYPLIVKKMARRILANMKRALEMEVEGG